MISDFVNLLIMVGFGIIMFVGIGIALQLMQQRDTMKRDKDARDHEQHET